YGWKGRDFIAGPDIYYNRARFYDPVLGKFIAEDPLGFASGDTNLYAFAWSNPRNWKDPSGLSAAVDDATLRNLLDKSAVAAVGCALSRLIVSSALEYFGFSDVHGVAYCWAMGTPPAEAKPAPLLLPYTPRPGLTPGGCTPDEDSRLNKWYHSLCDRDLTCEPDTGWAARRIIAGRASLCLSARQHAADVCYGGKADEAHQAEMDRFANIIRKCMKGPGN
ncbi:MAG: hypothetical protein KDJ12_03660, partial [Hyphomicrobiales bacterium]|nr:hypothetical protein [Hyphomicrobiales bacterium]